MTRTLTASAAALLLLAACSRSHDERGPVATPVALSQPAGSPAAPASLPGVQGKSQCQSDADCPGDRLCRFSDGACVARYPDRSLVASRTDQANIRQCEFSAIFFDFDSAELTAEARQWLDFNADCLKTQRLPSLFIEGHADVRGDSAYNANLSRRRAEAVAAYLAQRGVKVPVTVRPLGEGRGGAQGAAQQGAASVPTEQGLAWQRRVELRVQ